MLYTSNYRLSGSVSIFLYSLHLDYVMHGTGNSIGNMGGLQPSPQAFSLDPLSARSLGERVSLGEYLSVTSQLKVESRNDLAEKCLGT